MKVTSTYRARITNKEYYKAFSDTAKVYNDIVTFLIGVVNDNWAVYAALQFSTESTTVTEKLVHHTEKNPFPKYADFDKKFYKLPSYLRRATIAEAYGKVKYPDP